MKFCEQKFKANQEHKGSVTWKALTLYGIYRCVIHGHLIQTSDSSRDEIRNHTLF